MSDDNVTPITPSHTCASCKATIDTRDVYEGHGPTCMQPEVRIRRLERQVVELKDAHNHLVDVVTILIARADRLERFAIPGGMIPIGEQHGTSESPDTQRSGSPVLSPGDGLSERTLESLGWVDRVGSLPPYPGGPLTNPGPAEPERSPTAGADAAGEEPGRT